MRLTFWKCVDVENRQESGKRQKYSQSFFLLFKTSFWPFCFNPMINAFIFADKLWTSWLWIAIAFILFSLSVKELTPRCFFDEVLFLCLLPAQFSTHSHRFSEVKKKFFLHQLKKSATDVGIELTTRCLQSEIIQMRMTMTRRVTLHLSKL